MEFIKQWVICVCITLIISVIFSSFAPKGKMNSIYKLTIALFVFLSFLYPFKSFNAKNFKLDNAFSVNEAEDINNKSIEKMISNKVLLTLNENSILGANVISNVDYNNGEIYVESVSVSIPDEYDEDNIKSIIFDNLGINAEVHKIGY